MRGDQVVLYLSAVITTITANIPFQQQYIHLRSKRQAGLGGAEEGWGPWGSPSECSRTCGGGVQYQERTCSTLREDGSPECAGPSKIYMSCNVEECPEGSRDFRAWQCSRYNDIEFDGKFYEWQPYYGGHHKCELNCLAKGEKFYYRHASKVIDGTPCTRDSQDVCVDGICQPVGCDKMLGSTKKLDECHVCGGDGSSCKTVQGYVTTDNLQYGYSDVLLIPAGATSIKISEESASNNYLALRNKAGDFYLNGNYVIDLAKKKTFAGTNIKYNRGGQEGHGHQHILADGPTNEPLFVSVLRTDGPTPVINYKYSLPEASSSNIIADYQWVPEAWGECSRKCAGGIQTRELSCRDAETGDVVGDEICDIFNIPDREQECNTEPCEAEYHVGAWEACSTSCGKGVQIRPVFCQQLQTDDLFAIVTDDLCKGKRPLSYQPCNQDVLCPSWEVGPWSTCNRVCGSGAQTRQVICRAQHQLENAVSDLLPDALCADQEKPAMHQDCDKGPCEGREWVVSEWMGCNADCTSGYESRHVMCSSLEGKVFPDELCDLGKRPEAQQACARDDDCQTQPKWHYSQWSECSAKCGLGIQTRTVQCAILEDGVLKVVEDAACDEDLRMAETQDCNGTSCDGLWFSGPFGKCSDACGGGQMKREVMCFSNAELVDPSQCDSNSKPDEVDDCNQHPCDDDNLLVVGGCKGTQHGCCPDGITAAEGPNFYNCQSGDRIPVGLCVETDFGCCLDGVTPAQGPFNFGCPDFTCKHTEFGCCDDGQTPALGSAQEGCPALFGCEATAYGCCEDGITAALGPNKVGCEFLSVNACERSTHGCCQDGETPALGPNFEGCLEESSGELCEDTLYGCCLDGITAAQGASFEGCNELDVSCHNSLYGCCPDAFTAAKGPNYVGCPGVIVPPGSGCGSTAYGCCPDGETAALGLNGEGCDFTQIEIDDCENTLYGCCQDGFSIAHGPDFEGCFPLVGGCQGTRWGCCPDGQLGALGPNGEGCEINTETCDTAFYGCCPDGVTPAEGPNLEGCNDVSQHVPECDITSHGCCPDGITVAAGPNFEGCLEEGSYVFTCIDSPYGCCPDGESVAQGPNDAGCPSRMQKGAICAMAKDGGSCGNYTVKWYFDAAYGDCSRFWYGGCEGNGNRFTTREECQSSCIAPQGIDVCYLPQSVGRCGNTQQKYFYNSEKQQCETFDYGGCLGNENKFDTMEECNGVCVEPQRPDVCSQPQMPGPCRGQFVRWFYDKASGMCRQFLYGGCKGNDNRFATEEDCMQRCEEPAANLCQLPKDAGPCEAAIDQYYFNSETKQCERFMYGGCQGNANRFATLAECKSTCHELLIDQDIDICQLPKDPGPCKAYFERWYYNAETRFCEQFVYGGCQGNKNQFDSEAECRSSCNAQPPVDVCTLPRATGQCTQQLERYFFSDLEGRCRKFVYSGCEGNGNNFESVEECEKTCQSHLRVQVEGRERCSLVKDAGPCLANMPRYFYNSTEGVCQEFIYGGCEGNRNRFMTYEACMGHCGDVTELRSAPIITTTAPRQRPPQPDSGRRTDSEINSDMGVYIYDYELMLDDICQMPMSQGDCLGYEPMWYFDTTTQQCEQFVFTGCGGNENRFETQDECAQRCVSQREPVTGIAICALQAAAGPCREATLRWHYDQDSARCRQFYYGGCDGNENNFMTEEECESQCRVEDICRLPFETGPCRAVEQRFYYDEHMGQCLEFTYGGCDGNANNFVTMESCQSACRKQAPVRPEEEVSVGRGHDGDLCTMPSDAGTCYNWTIMWYYDVEAGQCSRFYYGGCEGNANRFEDQESCQSRCETVVPVHPIEPETPNEVAPETTQPEQPAVVPGSPEVCNQPKDPGTCTGFSPVWYFEPVTATCRRFLYGGCGGNGNNFDSREACEATCLNAGGETQPQRPVERRTTTTTVSPVRLPEDENVATDICSLQTDVGPCQAFQLRFYYDAVRGRCLQFQYGGCQGNYNNFKSEKECMEMCGSKQEQLPVQKTRESCRLPKEQGPCFAEYLRYHYDEQYDECRPFVYGGCQGNENNFESQEECYATCSNFPDARQILKPGDCFDSPDAGPCQAAEPRWYFNAQQGDCVAFYYGGCEGNGNNFRSYDDCIGFCSKVSETCGVIQCNMECPFGFARGPDGCPTCQCADLCDNYECGADMTCVVEEIQCFVQPCPGPQPVCKPTPRPGQCPVLNSEAAYDCVMECQHDHECPGATAKCCDNGCGKVCLEPDMPGGQPESGSKGCEKTVFGCCPDEKTPAKGWNFHGCTEEAPVIEPYTHDIVTAIGDRVVIPCRVRGAPRPVIDWYRNRIPLVDLENNAKFNALSDGSLEIVGVTEDDGSFTCRAYNTMGTATQTYYLVVHDRSEVLDKDDGIDIDNEITDQIDETDPYKPTTDWGGEREVDREGSGIDDTDTEPDSDGRVAPEFADTPQSVTANEGENIELPCQVSGRPRPQVNWLYANEYLNMDTEHFRMSSAGLMIEDISKDDEGTYMCMASNGVGEPIRRTITLNVIGSISVSIALHNESFHVGSDVELQCEVQGDRAGVTVEWLKDGLPLASEEEELTGRVLNTDVGADLLLENVAKDDVAKYECVATRGQQRVTAHTTFTVYGVSIPENCVDKPWYANCALIIEASLCKHPYFSIFCCKSCHEAGLLP